MTSRLALALLLPLLLAILLPSQTVEHGRIEAQALSAGLSQTVESLARSKRDTWITYTVPLQDGDFVVWSSWNNGQRPCRLSGDDGFSILNDEKEAASRGDKLHIFVRLEGGKATGLRAFTECSIDAGGATIQKLEGVSAEESIAFLKTFYEDDSSDKRVRRHVFPLIALHDSPEAGRTLERFTESRYPAKVRGDAVFWMVHTGSERGVEVARALVWQDGEREVQKKAVFALSRAETKGSAAELLRIAREHPKAETREEAVFWYGQTEKEKALPALVEIAEKDSDSEIREKAIFAISQVSGDDAARALVLLAREHPDRQVRKKAIFWLGQRAGKVISATLREMVDRDPDSDLRQHAVFAISQRPADESIPLLIELATTHKDPGVRKKALFWLGQSGDPRALEAIERILLK